jgi:hypothetical protein
VYRQRTHAIGVAYLIGCGRTPPTFTPSLHPDEIGQVRRLGQRLETATDFGPLFNRCRRLDERMERVERTLEELAIGWDRHIHEEVDRIRGN